MALKGDLCKIYAECSNGYHKVDDFRAKLLGFLPLASGIGIFGSNYLEFKTGSKDILSDSHIALGVFGVIVTFGLLIYELKGIEKCTQLIKLGSWIEGKMDENDGKGFFIELLLKNSNYVTKPLASAIIYSIVMAAWSYVIFLGCAYLKYIVPAIVFLSSFIFVYRFWQYVKR